MKTINPFSSFVDLLYPRRCVVCDSVLLPQENEICTNCWSDFPYFNVETKIERIFPDFAVRAFYPLFRYHRYSSYRRLIYAIKYRNGQKLAHRMGRLLGGMIPERRRLFDAIIPIPLHAKRMSERGFNQSELIARGIASAFSQGYLSLTAYEKQYARQEMEGMEGKYLAEGMTLSVEIPVVTDLLLRKRDNPSQTGMDIEQRRTNVMDLFTIHNPELWEGKHLLLVDDVLTTGATINAALQSLSAIPKAELSVATLGYATRF